MSGFALIYHRDGAPVNREAFSHMMRRLAHRGPDGQAVHCQQSVAMGHCQFWTTPEAVGERQPLRSADGRLALLFDGRLDNRDELLSSLRWHDPGGRQTSDAAIVLQAYVKWDEQFVTRLLGPFALAIYDEARQQVVCARDPLGDCTLFYYVDNDLLLIASEEQALLTHPAVSDTLDETALAYYFAVRAPSDGRTFFQDIREMLPSQVMMIGAHGTKTRRYWDVDPERRLVYRDDVEYAEQFRLLLDQSVQRCLRAVGPSAVMMSGGLDSTSVASLAARHLAAASPPERLTVISWVFDQFPMCDERIYMDRLIEQHNLKAIRISGDGDWPFRDAFLFESHNPGRPYNNPYHRLKRHLYQATYDNQTRVLLTGAFGDDLYTGAEDWLSDLLHDQRFLEVGNELMLGVRRFGFRKLMARRSLRRTGRQLLEQLPAMQCLLTLRDKHKLNQIDWLTPYARQKLSGLENWPPSADKGRRPDQHRAVLGMYSASGASSENSYASKMGVELRDPYRDRQLVEFMLSIPAYQLYRWQRHKHILRNAMMNLLPENILSRVGPTSLLPLYRYGLAQAEWQMVQQILNRPEAVWRRFVQPSWLEKTVWERLDKGLGGREALLVWRALNFEIWRERIGVNT
jgi:asparagine synthase (glutamine-hydrolysing)